MSSSSRWYAAAFSTPISYLPWSLQRRKSSNQKTTSRRTSSTTFYSGSSAKTRKTRPSGSSLSSLESFYFITSGRSFFSSLHPCGYHFYLTVSWDSSTHMFSDTSETLRDSYVFSSTTSLTSETQREQLRDTLLSYLVLFDSSDTLSDLSEVYVLPSYYSHYGSSDEFQDHEVSSSFSDD